MKIIKVKAVAGVKTSLFSEKIYSLSSYEVMPLPPDLDLTNLNILRTIATLESAPVREIEGVVSLGRSQVTRRLRQLETQGLVVKRNGGPRKTYFYSLSDSVTLEEIEDSERVRLARSRSSLSQELRSIIIRLRQVVRRLEQG